MIQSYEYENQYVQEVNVPAILVECANPFCDQELWSVINYGNMLPDKYCCIECFQVAYKGYGKRLANQDINLYNGNITKGKKWITS